LGNQLLSIFFIPVLIGLYFYVLKKSSLSYRALLPILTFMIGLSVYLVLPIISSYKPPLTIDYSLDSWQGFTKHVLGEDFQGSMFHWSKGNFLNTLAFYFSLITKSFPAYLWALIPVGFVVGWFLFPGINTGMFLIFISTLYFAMTYQNAAIERYYIPQFIVSTIWIAISLFYLITKFSKKVFKIVIYITVLLVTSFLLVNNFKSIDQSKNVQAFVWANQTLNSVDARGVVFSWWSYSTPLWYMQKVEDQRSDIKIVNASEDQWEEMAKDYLGTRPVYFIDKINLSNKNLKLEKSGNIYELSSVNLYGE